MAVSRVKVVIAGEDILAADYNAEFDNILNNGEDLAWPATKAKDLDGQELVLDADGDTSITADTDDRIDMKLSGTDLFRFLGTVATPVNGFDFNAAAAGSEPNITAAGSDTDINVNLIPKGAGLVQINSAYTLPAADGTANQFLQTNGSGALSFATNIASLSILATATASNDATVNFAANIDSTYDEYIFALLNIIPATDNVSLYLRTSADAGMNYDVGAADYKYAASGFLDANSVTSWFSTGATFIELASLVGSDANEYGVSAWIHLIRPAATSFTQIWWSGLWQAATGNYGHINGTGMRVSAAAVDAVRFLFSSGNVESGEFKLYGVKKS